MTKLMGRPQPGKPLRILGGCKRSEIGIYPLPSSDLYWSLNGFWKTKRETEPGKLAWMRGETKHLAELNALWVDLDFYRSDWANKSEDQIRSAVLEALGSELRPNIFAWSGRGAYVIYFLEPIEFAKVGRDEFWKSVRTWREDALALTNRLSGWGSDSAASISPSGVLRVPGSTNSKSGASVRFEILSQLQRPLEEITRSINQWGGIGHPIGQALRNEQGIKITRPVPAGLTKGSVAGLMQARFSDLNLLLEDRNQRGYNWEGIRNKFCFNWAQAKLQLFSKGVGVASQDELLAINDSFANGVSSPANEWEIRCITRDRAYTLRNSRIIADLMITEEEMRRLKLKTLISRKVKAERRRGHSGRTADGRTERSKARDGRVLDAVQEGCETVDQVVQATGVSRAGVYRALVSLKGVVVSVFGRLAVGGGGLGGGVVAEVQACIEQNQEQNPALPSVEQTSGETASNRPTSTKVSTAISQGRLREPDELIRELVASVPGKTFICLGSSVVEGGWMISDGTAIQLAQGQSDELRSIFNDSTWNIVGFDLHRWCHGLIPNGEPTAKLIDLRIISSLVDARCSAWGWKRMASHYLLNPGTSEPICLFQLSEFLLLEINRLGLDASLEEESKVSVVLDQIERRGVGVNVQMLEDAANSLAERMASLRAKIYERVGHSFDLSSTKEVSRLIYDELGLPVLKRTATGAPSSDSSVLEELALLDPIPGLISEFRKLSAAVENCIKPVLETVDVDQGRVHPEFHQGASVNGRLTTRKPNLQGIVGSGEIGSMVRQAFQAPTGKTFVGLDLSQIEIRALAHLSGDQGLLKLFWDGGDVYTLAASKAFAISEASITPTLRTWAKEGLIASFYGMGPAALAAKLRRPLSEAKEFIQRFNAAFPGIELWKQKVLEQARRNGFVTLPNGSRRYVDGLLSTDWRVRFEAERKIINAIVQGTAAIWFKRLLLALSNNSIGFELVHLVHDEALGECSEELVPLAVEHLKSAISWVEQGLHVPLVAKMGTGHTWHEVHRWRCPKQ